MATIDPIPSWLDRTTHTPHHSAQRILAAAHDDDACHVLADALRSDGYDVGHVCSDGGLLMTVSGTVAAKIAPDPVDLLIEMPMSTGLQFLERIRAAGRTMPVILMTRFVDAPMREDAAALGALVVSERLHIEGLRIVVEHVLQPGHH